MKKRLKFLLYICVTCKSTRNDSSAQLKDWRQKEKNARSKFQSTAPYCVCVGAKLKISPILRLSLAHFRILSLADILPAHLN